MIGRKKLYISGFIVFTFGSFLCGLSNTGELLLLYRFVQSIGGALIVANSTPIVADAFPKKELGTALGINGMVISVASVIGPVLGGAFIKIGWRYIFYINIPIGLIGTIWAGLQLKELNVLQEKQKFDWGGTIAFTLGMTSLLLALTFGGFFGWAKVNVVVLFIAAALFLALFWYVESKLQHPMFDLELSTIGLFISAVGLLGMVRISASTSVFELSVWMFISGLGSGMFFSPNTSAIMGAVPVERRGIAAGVRTMMNNVGSVISIALAMAIISSSIDPQAMQGLFSGTQVGSQGIAVGHFISGLRTAFVISFFISILAAFISYLRGPEPEWGR